MSQDLVRERKTGQRPTFDLSAVLLIAVAEHLNHYVHELKHTFCSVRSGVDGPELYVGSRYRCDYKTDTATLAAWAKTMTDVTVEAGVRGDSVHLTLKGKLIDNTSAEVTTVENGEDGRRWLDRLAAEDRTDVPVTLELLNEMAAQLEVAAESVNA